MSKEKIEEEKLITQFKNRALTQEASVRLVRYLVGSAVTAIVMAADYSGLTATVMIVVLGILYVGINTMYDKRSWEKPNKQ